MQQNKCNVLVFPCGSEIGLEIHRSLVFSKDFHLIGGSSCDDHGKFVYQDYVGNLPEVHDDDFIGALNSLIASRQINYIFPAHDDAVIKLAQMRDRINAIVITSPSKTCTICRSKSKTYNYFNGKIRTPKQFSIDQKIDYPVFLKPDIGQGSKGTSVAYSKCDLTNEFKKNPGLIILEFLPGKEFTIDCFSNYKGELLFAEGRIRKRVSNGISVNSQPQRNKQFHVLAETINHALELRGAWFFQCKEDEHGELTLLEIAPRIAGTMSLFRMMGVNFAELSLYDSQHIEISIIRNSCNAELDRALTTRYNHNLDFQSVYLDLDDTLICNDQVNVNLISLLFQFRNSEKHLVLLTRRPGNIELYLGKYGILSNLFSEIIQVAPTQKKSQFILNKSAIFIDDSFSERLDVFNECKIPVFSIDAIDLLRI